ncbi:MAG: hypothetical protein NTX97_13955 [Bacteroidetes bacterium]|nr:hypothetical protein [Bacteroidota bacterium]
MELIIRQNHTSPVIDYFLEQMKDLNLVYYASDVANEMEFENEIELEEALKRSMELCRKANIPLEFNFKRIYKSSFNGIIYDWKLSTLAYNLVCINGGTYNPNVAELQIQLIKTNQQLKNNS